MIKKYKDSYRYNNQKLGTNSFQIMDINMNVNIVMLINTVISQKCLNIKDK